MSLRYLAVLVVLAVGDLVWLGWFSKAVVRPTLGDLLLTDIRWTPAILFYLLYTAAILVFPLSAGLRNGTLASAMLFGAAFGFFAYMTYDLVNLATLKPWTVKLAVMDIAWGTLMTAVATGAGFLAAQRT